MVDSKVNIINDSLELSVDSLTTWKNSFLVLLPQLITGLVVFCVFIVFAKIIKYFVNIYFIKKDRIDLGQLTSKLSFWIITLIGFALAITIILPSLKSGDLVSGLGLSSLAFGFIFKDILQNWLSGLLILIRLPFRRGDQVRVCDVEGTVVRIEPRATVIRTYDGKDVIVPNTTIYTNEIIILTSQQKRRIELDLTVGYDYDTNFIRNVIEKALEPIEEVYKIPEIQILCWELGGTSLGIKIRWWVNSDKSSEILSRARVTQAIKEAFQANDIDPTDPSLVYVLSPDSSSADKHKTMQPKEKNEITLPKTLPPTYKMYVNDPETFTKKSDSRCETLLPSDEL